MKKKGFNQLVIAITIVIGILLFAVLGMAISARTKCPPKEERQVMYSAYDGSIVHGSNIIALLRKSAPADGVTFVIDNGVSVREYNGYERSMIDKNSPDTYIAPRDTYKAVVERTTGDEINLLTFTIVTDK